MSLPDRKQLSLNTDMLNISCLNCSLAHFGVDGRFPKRAARNAMQCYMTGVTEWGNEFEAFKNAVKIYGFEGGKKVPKEKADDHDVYLEMVRQLVDRSEVARLRLMSSYYADNLLRIECVEETMRRVSVVTEPLEILDLLADYAIGGENFLGSDDAQCLEELGLSIGDIKRLAEAYPG